MVAEGRVAAVAVAEGSPMGRVAAVAEGSPKGRVAVVAVAEGNPMGRVAAVAGGNPMGRVVAVDEDKILVLNDLLDIFVAVVVAELVDTNSNSFPQMNY